MKYWKRFNADKSINTVESYSHPLDIKGAIEITEQEFSDYISLLPVIEPKPVRDLAAELDGLKERVKELEEK